VGQPRARFRRSSTSETEPVYDARNLITPNVARARAIESISYLSAFRALDLAKFFGGATDEHWSRLLHQGRCSHFNNTKRNEVKTRYECPQAAS
jgi:hypothetical protein